MDQGAGLKHHQAKRALPLLTVQETAPNTRLQPL